MAAEAEGTIPAERALDAYVIPVGDGMRDRAVKVVTKLRVAGLRADIDLVGRGPTKNLDYANSVGARTAVLVGEKEARAGSVALRIMKTGAQSVVPLDGLAEAIRAS
jgi:histidyl-tRNA synthetase